MANTGISTKLLHYFQSNAGRAITIDELEKEFAGQYERRQIMSNVANLRQTNVGKSIQVLKTGVWQYESDAKNDDKSLTFTVLKALDNGGYVLMDGSEGIYRADRLA